MGRNVNTSYFTKGSQTPTGQKEFKYDLKSDNQGNSSEADELSHLDISREYIKEKNPQEAFKKKNINITIDGSVDDGGKSYMTGNYSNDKGCPLDKSVDQSYRKLD